MSNDHDNLENDPHTHVSQPRSRAVLLAAVFSAIVLLAGVDLASDIGAGASWSHWVLEGLLFVVALGGLGVMIKSLIQSSERATRLGVERDTLDQQLAEVEVQAQELSEQLQKKEAEAEQWRQEARQLLAGLGEAIARQFERWQLTDAEKEVALLLLKGLSHKEVADVRGTSDTTARQQARAVYKKAGLSGRNDLAAFFLEDLLLPVEQRSAD